MTQDEINESEWHKPENWTSGSKIFCVYFSHADSRTFVPKRNPKHGWTLNLAQQSGVKWLIGCILGPILFVILACTLVVALIV